MKAKTLWQVKVTVPPEFEADAIEVLQSLLDTPASAYTDQETGRTEVSVYLENPPPDGLQDTLAAALRLAVIELAGAAATIPVHIFKLPPRDWADYWKRHFKPVRVGGAFLIKPSWDKTQPRPGQITLVLDPGLSFGTGHHPTTCFCLRQIAHFSHMFSPADLLDVGTGTGILAIAAAKLGYSRIQAFDFDPDAVRVARQNARTNGVINRVKFQQADLTLLPDTALRPFGLVCANLTADLLLSQRAKLIHRVRPGGWLVLAGILATQFVDVAAAFQSAGLKLRRSGRRGEWQSALFLRQW